MRGLSLTRATHVIVVAAFVLVWVTLALVISPGSAYAAGETVSGRVTDAETGAPLADQSVTLYRMVWMTDGMDGRGYWWPEVVSQTWTGHDGSYTHPVEDTPQFETLPPGDYYMNFGSFGAGNPYTLETYDNIHRYGSYAFGSAVPFHVANGDHVTGIDAALEKDGILDIRLTTPNGAALDDVRVGLWVWDVPGQAWWEMTAFSTDSNGRLLTQYGIPAATYRLVFRDPHKRIAETAYGGGVFAEQGADVVIKPGETTQILAVLGPPAYATGRVLDASGNGLRDIQVTAYRYDPYRTQWAWASSALTDSTGRYTLIQTAGVYRYEYRDQAGTALNPGDDVTLYYPGVASLDSATSVTLVTGGTKILDNIVMTTATGVVSRVSGTDRYGTAVAASKRAFEDGTCQTVVLASGAAFPDALSASSLVGAVSGSLLLSRPDALPDSVITEIRRLGADEVYVVGGPAAIGDVVTDRLANMGVSVRRVFGRDRYATSVAVAREVAAITGLPASEVIVTRGDVFADAVAASGVASGLSIPVLLTQSTALPAAAEVYLTETTPQTVVLLGGTAAISPTVETQITEITDDLVGAEVTRVSGLNRYSTTKNFATWCLDRGWTQGTHVAVANGASFPDALSAGAAVGRDHGCVLLTRKEQLDSEPRSYIRLRRLGLTSAIVYGGPAAVSSRALFDIGTAIDQD